MAEHDVAVGQRRAIFGQFFKAKDDRILWGEGPRILGHNLAARAQIAVDWNGAVVAFLNRHFDASGNQGRRPFGR